MKSARPDNAVMYAFSVIPRSQTYPQDRISDSESDIIRIIIITAQDQA